MPNFEPLLQNPHLQTLAGNFWKRPDAGAQFPIERRLVPTEPGVKVLVESQRPAGEARGEIVMVHGLEGSGKAGYMRSLAVAALRAGFAAHRFHMRTCGGTGHLCNTLYHAGLTSDLLAFLRELGTPAFLVGFSLGGNVVLKLAGELGESASGGSALLRGVCAISTPIDLAACARRIGERDNLIYERNFASRMSARLLATGRYSRRDLAGLSSVFQIDDRITAPSFGFGNALNYYKTQSAARYLDAIRVPALLIQAKDDTFIPFGVFESQAVKSNPNIELVATEHGGHLGFIGRWPHRFWVDAAIMEWIMARAGTKAAGAASG
ncbi:MAG: alpha/beta fold hydrolase [Bryobacteraceae bacterium]|jgi:predicted alpha/beta-fold hydrolase